MAQDDGVETSTLSTKAMLLPNWLRVSLRLEKRLFVA